jgi:hypothetical protein
MTAPTGPRRVDVAAAYDLDDFVWWGEVVCAVATKSG